MTSKPSILIVDDNPTNLQLMCNLLGSTDYDISVATSGNMALENLEYITPSLILLDVMMPGMNGIETCRWLKSNEKTKDIPVIFMSALSDPLDVVQGFKAGAVDYIAKPIQLQETLARVETHLTLQAAKAEIQRLNQMLEAKIEERTQALELTSQQLIQEASQHRLTSQNLLQNQERLRSLFEFAPIGMAILSVEGEFLNVNSALCETLAAEAQELLGQNWTVFIHGDDLPELLRRQHELENQLQQSFKLDVRYLTQDEQTRHGVLQVVRAGDEGEPYLIAQFMDITQRKHAEDQLRFHACHDVLTKLPNRSVLQSRLEAAIECAQCQPDDYRFALLFLDINRFKMVNDSLGHRVGDQLLVAIAQRLTKLLRSRDMIARLGGDEFVILLEPIRYIQDAIHIAERLTQAMNPAFVIEGHELFIGTSIGIVLGSNHYNQAEDMIRDADIAMYRAKMSGKSSYEVFNQSMYTQVSARLQLESDLHLALERQEFQAYYQPIIDLQTNALIGFEALLRWLHPKNGIVSPADFIPIAEDTGLIVPMGHWVLQTACRQWVEWSLLYPHLTQGKMSVNLSLRQLQTANFVETVDRVLEETGMPATALQLEITESMLMGNTEMITRILQQLRDRGIHLSIDDFGTGYSCLSYLQQLPISHLKVDRAFVSGINEAGENQAIAKTVVALAQQLGLRTIAEGVETDYQRRYLQSMGCEAAQGYLFAKPLNREAASSLLQEQAKHYSPAPWNG